MRGQAYREHTFAVATPYHVISHEMKGGIHLSIPCGCDEKDIVAEPQPEERCGGMAKCPALVHDTVCVQADVTISPEINVGRIETFCVGRPVIGVCPGKVPPAKCCSFTVSQNIRVQVPLMFSAYAKATPTGIVCGMPGIGKCDDI